MPLAYQFRYGICPILNETLIPVPAQPLTPSDSNAQNPVGGRDYFSTIACYFKVETSSSPPLPTWVWCLHIGTVLISYSYSRITFVP